MIIQIQYRQLKFALRSFSTFLNENCYQTNNRFHQENFKKFKLKYKFYIGGNYVRS